MVRNKWKRKTTNKTCLHLFKPQQVSMSDTPKKENEPD